MGHREAARRAYSAYDLMTGLSIIGGATAIVSGYLVFGQGHHNHASGRVVEIFIGALVATFVFLRMRIAAAGRMKYHFDRVNMTGLIANWGGGMKRSKRERAARIIGRR
jgi:hypothetical protein